MICELPLNPFHKRDNRLDEGRTRLQQARAALLCLDCLMLVNIAELGEGGLQLHHQAGATLLLVLLQETVSSSIRPKLLKLT